MDFLDTSIRPTFDNCGQYRYVVGLDGINSEANPYLTSNNPILYFKLMPFIKDGRDFGYENGEDVLAATIVDMWDQDVGCWYGTDVLERPLDLLASWRYERPESSRTGVGTWTMVSFTVLGNHIMTTRIRPIVRV